MGVTRPKVGVIGAGAGGIAMGIQLADGGYDFTIFDRADGFGGTWRHNTFPGAACDVPSHLYSYSFALNPRWSKTYANQPEILRTSRRWPPTTGWAHTCGPTPRSPRCGGRTDVRRWTLTTEAGGQHDFDVVVSAVGNARRAPHSRYPWGAAVSGPRNSIRRVGITVKSTAGERVASIGTGASAIQYVPAIAAKDRAAHGVSADPDLDSPRFDFPFTPEQHELFERDPSAAQKLRDEAFDAYESSSFDVDAEQTREATELARSYLMRKVADPGVAGKADAGLSGRLQAAADVARVVSHFRVCRTSSWKRPPSPS